MSMRIGVIGAGSWGTALAQVLSENGYDVLIYARNPLTVKEINGAHTNQKYLGSLRLCETLRAVTDWKALAQRDMYILAVPVVQMENIARQVSQWKNPEPAIFVNVAKGFFPGTHERMIQLLERCIDASDRRAVVSLIGPSFAGEVAAGDLTAVCAVSVDTAAAKIVQQAFSNEHFRVYTSSDVTGCETAAALKNVMALAAGMSDGLGLGDNARSALITRGLAEITRFGEAQGASSATFLGLTGVGDLVLTCTSRQSRNYWAGYKIGQQDGAEVFLRNNQKTVEGINTAAVVYPYAEQLGVAMPITREVYRVLFEQEKPSAAIHNLMTRRLKAE